MGAVAKPPVLYTVRCFNATHGVVLTAAQVIDAANDVILKRHTKEHGTSLWDDPEPSITTLDDAMRVLRTCGCSFETENRPGVR